MNYNNFFNSVKKSFLKKPMALFCNHTSYDNGSGRYFLQILEREGNLKKIFIPEHGFFAELQDQEPVDNTSVYSFLSKDTKFISLYGNKREQNGILLRGELKEVEVLVIDIQDIGSRYFTYVTLIGNIFDLIHQEGFNIKVIVIDRPNPAGRQVEGTLMTAEYASFIGQEGLPHRHGLTLGEICNYLHVNIKANFPLEVIRYSTDSPYDPVEIYPSPNMPSINAVRLFSGTCLLEGTNISEGRGTTRTFEMFGAPFLQFVFSDKLGNFNKLSICENKKAISNGSIA